MRNLTELVRSWSGKLRSHHLLIMLGISILLNLILGRECQRYRRVAPLFVESQIQLEKRLVEWQELTGPNLSEMGGTRKQANSDDTTLAPEGATASTGQGFHQVPVKLLEVEKYPALVESGTKPTIDEQFLKAFEISADDANYLNECLQSGMLRLRSSEARRTQVRSDGEGGYYYNIAADENIAAELNTMLSVALRKVLPEAEADIVTILAMQSQWFANCEKERNVYIALGDQLNAELVIEYVEDTGTEIFSIPINARRGIALQQSRYSHIIDIVGFVKPGFK